MFKLSNVQYLVNYLQNHLLNDIMVVLSITKKIYIVQTISLKMIYSYIQYVKVYFTNNKLKKVLLFHTAIPENILYKQ